jgi:hypothetical protein
MTGEVSPRGTDDVGEMRASHEDRDRVAELLRVAAGDGRLTADELDERLEKALTARTYGELAVLARDLPGTSAFSPGDSRPVPKKLVRIDCQTSSAKRDGPWLVPERMEIQVGVGSVVLDFTEAVITLPTLQINAEVRLGSLVLVTRPGIVVDADDVSVQTGEVKVRTPWGPEVPVILRIQLSGSVSVGQIAAQPPGWSRRPRRTFWLRLRRRPQQPQLGR